MRKGFIRTAGLARRVPLVIIVCSALAPAQKDLSLETLARAMEGRIGVYAKRLGGSEEIAINADKGFPAGGGLPGPLAESRPAGGGDGARREAMATARQLAAQVERLHRALPRAPDDPARRALVEGANRTQLAPGISPTIEVGGYALSDEGSPGIAGYAACSTGEIVFCVLATGLATPSTAALVFPEVVEACFRRLVPGFAEMPHDPRPQGMLLASMHGASQDPRFFPPSPNESVAELRGGSQRLRFHLSDVARLAVLARPARATIVTVQWWSPAERPEACASRVIDGGGLQDALFDVPVDKLGTWRVRVAFGGVIVLDEPFYVTAK